MIRQIHVIRLASAVAFAGAFVALALHSTGAAAADLGPRTPQAIPVTSPVPVQNWAGLYVGVHGGATASGFKSTGATPNIRPLTFTGRHATGSESGGMLGVQAGYNFQSGALVYGIEGEASFSPSHDRKATTGLRADQKGRYALKGRLGYSFGSTLVYGTTGVAFSQARVTSPATGGFAAGKRDLSQTGFLIGAGVEQKITEAISVKGEVDYAAFGKTRLTFPSGRTKVESGNLSAKVGLNYRF